MCIFEHENNVCAIGAYMYSSNNERQQVATKPKYFYEREGLDKNLS